MMKKIFLSFSSNDAEFADAVGNFLEEKGYEVSHEKADGFYFYDSVDWVDYLTNSDLVIAFFSRFYKVSKRLQSHLTFIQQQSKPLIPILLDGNMQNAVPFGFENYSFIDASIGLEKILEQVMLFIEKFDARKLIETTSFREVSIEIIDKEKMENNLIEVNVSGQSRSGHKIFIAYAREQRSIAKELNDLLRAKGEFVFWDAKLRAGANWRQTIQRALNDCTHIIVIWTPNAAQSDEVEREVSYALAKRKTIIPILSEEVPELPYHLYGLHYLVLQNDLKSIENDLITAIEQLSNDDLFS
jgi:histone H3/H4